MPQLSVPFEPMFTAADFGALRQARQSLNALIQTLDKAAACGIDCSMYHAMRDDLDKQLEAIQQHFMTPPPGGKVKISGASSDAGKGAVGRNKIPPPGGGPVQA